MRTWLSRLLGYRDPAPASGQAPPAPARIISERPNPAVARPASEARGRELTAADVAFLSQLGEPPSGRSLDSLSPDDRTFVAGIQRCLRTRELDLPVLPEISLRLTRLFREGAPVSEFVALLNTDTSLAVEVLKAANSVFYATGTRLTSLQDAIVRVGLERLQSVIMVAHLRGKVLKTGPFDAQADLLLELTLPVGHLASQLARGHQSARDVCFMRGALLHVEHLVILGATSAVARDVKRTIVPSPEALHYAFVRSGRPIREALAATWNLPELLLGGDDETGVADEYALIRRVLVCQWLRLPLPEAASTLNGLAAALADIAPRVPPVPEPVVPALSISV